MTREEQHIAVLRRLLESMDVYDSIQPTKERKKAIKAAIQALSQEPCDDAVSRQAALNSLIDNTHLDGYDLAEALDAIENKEKLPSVTQKPETVTEFADRCRECGARYGKLLKQKSGKWLYKEITDDYRVTGQCSECRERRIIDNFCPNCGCHMVEPQERSDKE